MGSPGSERFRENDEGPVHPVKILHSLAVGKYEVTFDEWDACVSDGGCEKIHALGSDRGRHPVHFVDWHYTKQYVGWLSRKTGEAYRLLSESEWEYVARAGTTGPFSTGATITTGQANYDGRFRYLSRPGCESEEHECHEDESGLYRGGMLPVGSFAPNAFGLHDVHGNAWEWVEDCYNESYWGAPSDGSAWEDGACDYRVLRGGSWHFKPWQLRSAARYGYPIGNRNVHAGFRVARALD